MRKRLPLLAVAGLVFFAALPAFSQGNPTGTISGQVVDPDGLALPGVTVTAESPALQGTRTAVTSANGDYIIPFLPPGEYTVGFELSGFQTVKLSRRLAVADSIPLDARLQLSGLTETVTVVGEAPGDFAQTAPIASSYKQELIDRLPLNRTLRDTVLLTPSASDSGPNGGISIAGAQSYEGLYLINGVVVNENLRGQPFDLFIEDAVEETKITTGSVSAEYGRFAGGIINAITKSGGNEFHGSFRTTFENDDWRALTPFTNDTKVDDVVPSYEMTLGGPVLKDKIWFFGASRLKDETEARQLRFTNIPFEFGRDEKRYEGKLTISPVADHTFKFAYINIDELEANTSFGTVMDGRSLYDRTLPQWILSANYTGILSPNFFVEAQYSRRRFTFEGSGSRFSDLVDGTLLLDRSRGSARYWSPTFCAVCTSQPNEERNNKNYLVKASYFASTKGLGSHNIVFGVDVFDDERAANNSQSGSDYRIFGTSAILGSGDTIFPVFDNTGSTFIRWNPIFQETQGNRYRTISAFLNDTWRLSDRWSFNVGVRFDKNDGQDGIGRPNVKDSAISPRLALSWDPKGDGLWTVNAGFAKYVTAIANAVGDDASPGGSPANFDFTYSGPAINTPGAASPCNAANPCTPDVALPIVWDWFFANGGTNRPLRGAPTLPGVNLVVDDRLVSPSALEYTLGVTRRLGSRGLVRLDGVFRDYEDFYSSAVNLGTGRVTNDLGQQFDLAFYENTNAVDRKYWGVNTQLSFRALDDLELGGNYTLSRAYGNFDGETGPSGPVTTELFEYPEYREERWHLSEGDLAVDQRHKLRLWATWQLPVSDKLGRFSLGVLEVVRTGSPYGAEGLINPSPFRTNPGYLTPPQQVEYWFLPRDAFRMETESRTDINLTWSYRIPGFGDRTELFFRGTVLNLFDQQALSNFFHPSCGTGGCINTTINTNNNSNAFRPFDPFTTTPVQGVHWDFGSSFGQPTSRFAYQTPRTYGFAVGFRF